MLEKLKEEVFRANLELQKKKLVVYTWGNVSGIDRKNGLIVIKPSGVPYESMSVEDMVVVDMEGKVVEGKYKASSDTPTHIELYKAFLDIGGVVHTHSSWATSWAQACRSIPPYGTTHADYFYGEIPCTRILKDEEINGNYEKETGKVIIETFKIKKINENSTPAIIVANHGPFTWGKTPSEAVHNAVVVEEISKMAFRSEELNKKIDRIEKSLLNKHYMRKHGINSYYGQN